MRSSSNSKVDDQDFAAWGAALQPWFLPRSLLYAINRMLPLEYRMKMLYYFEDYGCLKCGRKSERYAFNGFCTVCAGTILARIRFSLLRRQRMKKQRSIKSVTRSTDAYRLLRDL
jgi:hypothetical protein